MHVDLQSPEGESEKSTTETPTIGRRRKLLSGCLVLVLAAAIGAGYMLWTVQQVPDFYRRAAAQVSDPGQRAAAAAQFEHKIELLQIEVQQSAEWTETFSQDEINSWLQREAEQRPETLPEGVSRPLIVVDEGRFHLGVEVNWNDWAGIISLEADATITGPRAIEFRLQHVRLGNLDIAMEEVRSHVEPRIEAIESDDYHASWIETPDGPVIKVELTDDDSAHMGLSDISLTNGRLTIRGINKRAQTEDSSNQRP